MISKAYNPTRRSWPPWPVMLALMLIHLALWPVGWCVRALFRPCGWERR